MLEKAGADLNHINKRGVSVLIAPFLNSKKNLTSIEEVMEYLLTKTSIGERENRIWHIFYGR